MLPMKRSCFSDFRNPATTSVSSNENILLFVILQQMLEKTLLEWEISLLNFYLFENHSSEKNK